MKPKGGETLLTFQAGLGTWGKEITQKQAIAFQYIGNEKLAASGLLGLAIRGRNLRALI